MNVRKMNSMGYTGKGITVAVVDTPIIMHDDIKSSLVGYEVMNNALAYNMSADFHGQATSGILCGDETGVAPDSKLVYFATQDNLNDGLQALKRILAINEDAERNNQPENKIRVVSLSWGFNEGMEGYEEFKSLLKELYNSCVFVATADFNMVDESITGGNFARCTLEKKNQQGNPNDYNNYIPIFDVPGYTDSTLFILSGDKTVASATNPSRYRHDSQGSTSWSVPTLAGIYTCALQCADENGIELTPKLFWDYAYRTGKEMYDNGEMVGKDTAQSRVHVLLAKANHNRLRSLHLGTHLVDMVSELRLRGSQVFAVQRDGSSLRQSMIGFLGETAKNLHRVRQEACVLFYLRIEQSVTGTEQHQQHEDAPCHGKACERGAQFVATSRLPDLRQ
jgi:hypothetical protein